MKAERIDEYHKSGCHFYGKLAVVHYLDDAKNDPKWGTFSAGLDKAMALIKERYGEVEVLLSVPDLVVRVA